MLETNKIYHGDCIDLMKELSDKSVDFAFADPPYGINKAHWDLSYISIEKELLRISRKGIAVTPGQENIAKCITAMGDEYKGIVSAWNINGMTFSKIGFENWIPVVMGGKIKRGQNCFRFVVKNVKPNHPSPKPLEFMKELILRFTDENDLVLDPFLGSGTTAVACIKTNRKFIGIEIDKHYYEIAQKRIDAELSQLKLNL